MAFLDVVLGKDEKERKLEKEIRSLELRKESVLSSIDTEIAILQSERSDILLEAGTKAYDVWCKDNSKADLTEYWNKVQGLDKEIAEQEEKKIQMKNRYDEEILLINGSIGIRNTGAGTICPKCGAAVAENDVFCQKCGEKVK